MDRRPTEECRCERNEKSIAIGPSLHDVDSVRECTSLACIVCPRYDVGILLEGIEKILQGNISSAAVVDEWRTLLFSFSSFEYLFSNVTSTSIDMIHPGYGKYRTNYICFILVSRLCGNYIAWDISQPSTIETYQQEDTKDRRHSSPEKDQLKNGFKFPDEAKRNRSSSVPSTQPSWWDNYQSNETILKLNKKKNIKMTFGDVKHEKWEKIFQFFFHLFWKDSIINQIHETFIIKILKELIIYKNIFDLFIHLEINGQKWIDRLIYHSYSNEIVTFLHGFIFIEFYHHGSIEFIQYIFNFIQKWSENKNSIENSTKLTQILNLCGVFHDTLDGKLPNTFRIAIRNTNRMTSFETSCNYLNCMLQKNSSKENIFQNNSMNEMIWTWFTIQSKIDSITWIQFIKNSLYQIREWNEKHLNLPKQNEFMISILNLYLRYCSQHKKSLSTCTIQTIHEIVPIALSCIMQDLPQSKIHALAINGSFSDSEDDSENEMDEPTSIEFIPSSIDHKSNFPSYLLCPVVEFLGFLISHGHWDDILVTYHCIPSLLKLFKSHPRSNQLHIRLTSTILSVFDRDLDPSYSLLKSAFQDRQRNLLVFIMNAMRNRVCEYRGFASQLGVKIHQICSSRGPQQEVVERFCRSNTRFLECNGHIIAMHYRQLDELKKHNLNETKIFLSNSKLIQLKKVEKIRNPDLTWNFALDEIHPFHNENDLNDIPIEKNNFIVGQVYCKTINLHWNKVLLKINRINCTMKFEFKKNEKITSNRFQFFRRISDQSIVITQVREWIAFGRELKNPNSGSFGFQITGFDPIHEIETTQNFIVHSLHARKLWISMIEKTIQSWKLL